MKNTDYLLNLNTPTTAVEVDILTWSMHWAVILPSLHLEDISVSTCKHMQTQRKGSYVAGLFEMTSSPKRISYLRGLSDKIPGKRYQFATCYMAETPNITNSNVTYSMRSSITGS